METVQKKNNKGEVFIFIAFIFIILPFILALSTDWLRNSVLDKFLDLFLLSRGIYFSSVLLCLIFSILALINNKKSRGRMAAIALAVIFIIWNVLFLFFNILSLFPIKGGPHPYVSIKADISSLRASAELFANNNENYSGFCNSQDVSRAKAGISADKSDLICNDGKKEWAACAQLVVEKSGKLESYYCSDSDGNSIEIQGQCDENWKYTKCPK